MKVLPWILLTALYVVCAIVAERYGAISYLTENDSSYICYVLLAIFGAGSAFAVVGQIQRVQYLSEVAPLLGLAGTVYGLIQLFSGGFEDVSRIGQGLGTAMNTTLMGVIVSIGLSVYVQFSKDAKTCN